MTGNCCRCLVALKTHPKLAEDSAYQEAVSKLLSENFSPWVIGDGLESLRSAWKRVEQGLDNKPTPKPLGYVSLGWYATSMAALILLAALLGLGLVYTLHRHNLRCFCHFLALSNLIGWQHISPLVEMTKAQFMAVLSIST